MRDPHADILKSGVGTPAKAEKKPSRRVNKTQKEGNWGWATAAIVGGWTLFFLLGLYSYEAEEE